MQWVDIFLSWAAQGLVGWTWWQILLYTLLTTHITIAAVTIFLHRAQAHRALDLHPLVSHFFRFWLWIGTGMITKEWVAIHRKHHAKCETEQDPHSPQTRGLKTVFWQGAELYRAEAKNEDTLSRYGHGTPDDWVEHHIYSRFKWQGVGLMLILNLVLFGALGLTVWAVQMLWIPISAAGVINGIAHYWGYRNFEVPDASTNISPWGILIGGEELHNNHHTYPTSAKFKVKPYEFDIGWVYIKALSKLGLASVKKIPPIMQVGSVRPVADDHTLEALIAHRYAIMAQYAKVVQTAVRRELATLKAAKLERSKEWVVLKTAKRWLHRDAERIPAKALASLKAAQERYPTLAKMVAMRGELQKMWQDRSMSKEQLVHHLADWCSRAESSGIKALRDFAISLRAVRVAA